jgi:hypothetical protein
VVKHAEFVKLYVEKKEIPFFVDENGKPKYRDTYPKGKNLYEKGEQLYQYNQKMFDADNANGSKLLLGNKTLGLLDKLISIASTDTKDIDNQLKKAATNEDISKVLGL